MILKVSLKKSPKRNLHVDIDRRVTVCHSCCYRFTTLYYYCYTKKHFSSSNNFYCNLHTHETGNKEDKEKIKQRNIEKKERKIKRMKETKNKEK